FLFDWRSALVSVVSIPVALVAGVIALYLTGATINTMILAGLVVALAVVIDDAVVDVETLLRRLRERKQDGASVATLIRETTLQTRSAALYSTLIVILAVTPIFFMGGMSGAFFEPLAWSYLLAVLASMIVALTVTPALSLLLRGEASRAHRESPEAVWRLGTYDGVLQRIVTAPRKAFIAVVVVVVAGLGVLPLLVLSCLRDKGREVLTGAIRAIVVRISGPKREVLNQKAEEVRQALSGIAGIVDLRAEGQVDEPTVQVKVKLGGGGPANVKPGGVR